MIAPFPKKHEHSCDRGAKSMLCALWSPVFHPVLSSTCAQPLQDFLSPYFIINKMVYVSHNLHHSKPWANMPGYSPIAGRCCADRILVSSGWCFNVHCALVLSVICVQVVSLWWCTRLDRIAHAIAHVQQPLCGTSNHTRWAKYDLTETIAFAQMVIRKGRL